MRVLAIFTGGTIGSSKKDDWVSLDPLKSNELLEDYKNRFHNEVSFETLSPFAMHSENLSAENLTLLVKCIWDNSDKNYDGIVVTHGTDTLQYSASAASYCLGGDCIPVVFASSNYPLEDSRSNGRLNFEAAVKFIASQKGKGVYISYSNDGVNADIHYAERVLYHPELSDMIFSVGKAPFYYKNGEIKTREQELVSTVGKALGAVSFCHAPKILRLCVTPFEEYLYDPKVYNAAVFLPYHSGTLNTESQAFKNFCRRFSDAGVPLFLPDVPSSSAYDSMRQFESLGITVLPETAQIPLLIKVWLAISLNKNTMDFIKQPLCRECVLN